MQSFPFFYYQGVPMPNMLNMQQNVPNVPMPGPSMPSVQQGPPMPMAMPGSSMSVLEQQQQQLLSDEERKQKKRYEIIRVLCKNLNIKRIGKINEKMYFIFFYKERKHLYMYSDTLHRKIHSKGKVTTELKNTCQTKTQYKIRFTRIFLHFIGKVENVIKSDKSITRRTQGKFHAICYLKKCILPVRIHFKIVFRMYEIK